MDWKDVFERASWTFVQAIAGPMIAFLATTQSGVVDLEAGAQSLVIGVGAGLAALLSLIKTVAQQRLGTGGN